MSYNWRNYEPSCCEPDGEEIDESEEEEVEEECSFEDDEPPERFFDDIDAAHLNDIMVDNTMSFVYDY